MKKKLTPEQEHVIKIVGVVSQLKSEVAKEKLISYGEGMIAVEKMNRK